MSDKAFCPKCATGTIRKFSRNEQICDRCGTMTRPEHVTKPPQESRYGPRPGGNRYAG